MLQQLQLSFDRFDVEPRFTPSSDPLLEQTRQLFQHQGSDAELIVLIQKAIAALSELSDKPEA